MNRVTSWLYAPLSYIRPRRDLPALALVMVLVPLSFPRARILTIDARSEVVSFVVGDNRTTQLNAPSVEIVTDRAAPAGSRASQEYSDIALSEGTQVAVTRLGTGKIELSLTHPTSAGSAGGLTLPARCWLYLAPTVDGSLVLPFVGPFTLGSLAAPASKGILLEGSAEVVERTLLGRHQYVNQQTRLKPGDFVGIREDIIHPDGTPRDGLRVAQSTMRGFVYVEASTDSSPSGVLVHLEADPSLVELRRASRLTMWMGASLWGRVTADPQFALLVFILSSAAALAQIMSYFVPSPERETVSPASSSSVSGVPTSAQSAPVTQVAVSVMTTSTDVPSVPAAVAAVAQEKSPREEQRT